jgi:hypothetical protein
VRRFIVVRNAAPPELALFGKDGRREHADTVDHPGLNQVRHFQRASSAGPLGHDGDVCTNEWIDTDLGPVHPIEAARPARE